MKSVLLSSDGKNVAVDDDVNAVDADVEFIKLLAVVLSDNNVFERAFVIL